MSKSFRALIVLVLLLAALPGGPALAGRSARPAEPAQFTPPATEPVEPAQSASQNLLLNALQKGRYPAQLATQTGDIQPSRYGPQRNEPAEGMLRDALSPFDKQANREYACPPGSCDFTPAAVLATEASRSETPGIEWTEPRHLRKPGGTAPSVSGTLLPRCSLQRGLQSGPRPVLRAHRGVAGVGARRSPGGGLLLER